MKNIIKNTPKEKIYYSNEDNIVIQGDTLSILKTLPDESIDLIITSPPYYGLRDYQVDGQIGLEKDFEEYLKKLLAITAELKRVLKKTGQLWWNHGDAYGGSLQGHGASQPSETGFQKPAGIDKRYCKNKPPLANMKQKCLLMQPERLAIRMIDEQGWLLRNKIVWAKAVLLKKENRTIGGGMPTCLLPETEVYIKQETGIVVPITLGELVELNTENLLILSPTGWKKIKNMWKVEHDKTMKFKVGSSSEIESSLQHKFPISHDNRRKRYEIKEVQNLRIGKNKMLDRFLFKPIADFIEDKNLELCNKVLTYRLGKFIGLYAAEGGFADYSKFKSYQGKFTLNKLEDDLCQDIIWGLRLFGVYFKITKIKNYQTIVFSSREIKEFISRFVLGKCKEKRLDMVSILNTNKKFRQGIFDGLIAGDGHIDKNKRISFGSVSRQLRDDLYLLASSVGLLASKSEEHEKDKRTGKVYDAYLLTIPISLQKEKNVGEREFVKRKPFVKGKPPLAIYKNEFEAKTLKFSNPQIIKGNKWLIDIEVEDGLFLINGGIVSHNSTSDRFNESSEFLYFFVKNKKYYSNLNEVRIPHQTFENRPAGVVRAREWNYDSKYNKFNYRPNDNKQQKASKEGITAQIARKYGYDPEGICPICGRSWKRHASPNASDRKTGLRREFIPCITLEEIKKYENHGGSPKYSNSPSGVQSISKPGGMKHAFSPLGKNLPTVWQVPFEFHNFEKELGVDTEHFACVDEETECLTLKGWTKYNELKKGNIIASFNLKTNKLEWDVVKDLFIFDFNGNLLYFPTLGIMTTFNHRVIRKDKAKKQKEWSIKEANKITSWDIIPIASDWENGSYGIIKNNISPEFCEILGWICAEGHFNKYGIDIYQSVSANPKKVDRIRNLLIKEKIKFSERHQKRISKISKKEFEMVTFGIAEKESKKIFSYIPNKKPTFEMLGWEKEQIRKFLDGFILGDGHIRKDDGRISITQKDENTIDILMALAFRLGYSVKKSFIKEYFKNPAIFRLYLSNKKYKGIRSTNGKLQKEIIEYNGKIWCPQTYNSTFVARRDNKIFITGNSFPGLLIETPILFGCPPGGIVLDPFCGSGTSLLVAKKLGRKAIGIELNEGYCKITKKRLQSIPNSLFDKEVENA